MAFVSFTGWFVAPRPSCQAEPRRYGWFKVWEVKSVADPSVKAPERRSAMTRADTTASPRLRVMFAAAAAIMFALWGWSLVPPIQNWGNPNEDGFSYVGVFYATLFCLPVGLLLLAGAIAGRGGPVRRARVAFFVAAAMTGIVAAFLIVQNIANNNDGKVFGIQIGSRLDRQNADAMS